MTRRAAAFLLFCAALPLAAQSTDFGDAPDSYQTLLASNGARHTVVAGFSLGAAIDAEIDGQPGPAADGDGLDEDGVSGDGGFACGGLGYIVFLTNTAAIAAPRLDAWVDWDGDGAFNDPRDRVHTATPLVPGSNLVQFTVPCDVVARSTYARFRLSDGGVTGPAGNGGAGEVQDTVFTIEGLDYGDAPASYPVLRAANGARHRVMTTNNPTLGTTVDTEIDGQPSAGADGDGADESGVTVPATLVAGAVATITLRTGATGGYVSCWVDFARDGDFTDAGEKVVAELHVAANQVVPRAIAVPVTVRSGRGAVRCRIKSSASVQSADGFELSGEVEDYVVDIIAYDFGDATDAYRTTIARNGARHRLVQTNNPTLGPTVDAEADGQVSFAFDGDDTALTDDENGVGFGGALFPASTGSMTLRAGPTGGIVTCWIDFDGNRSWTNDAERVVLNLTLAARTSASPSFAVPERAPIGLAGVRCRISSLGELHPTGEAPDGEVEDHAVVVGGDFGDAPYGTAIIDDGARHHILSGFSLGATVDAEADGLPSPNATRDGADEDGVVLPVLTACNSGTVTITLTNSAGIATPRIDAWIDFDRDETFEPAERILDHPLAAGTNVFSFAVPCGVSTSVSYARFRLSSAGVGGSLGAAPDGEVEDYAVILQGLDFGDAADPTYPTRLASNGARHVVLLGNNPTIGSTVDTEADGAATAGATGDDAANGDDESGVVFGPLFPGEPGQVTIVTGPASGFVNLWIDLDQDGDWNDSGEHVAADQSLPANATQQYTFAVPLSSISGALVARARISSQPGLGVTGQAADGEVEDHAAALLGEARIDVTLDVVSTTFSGVCGIYDVAFDVHLQNLGNVALTNVQATTPLAGVFVAPATYDVTSIVSSELAVNPAYDGNAVRTMLLPGATLAAGQSATIRVVVQLAATCRAVTYVLGASGSGQAADGSVVSDDTENDEPAAIVVAADGAPIPTLHEWALIAIAALLALAATRRL